MRHRAKNVTTKKEHKCWYCGCTISVGEMAIKFFAVDTDRGNGAIHGYACAYCERVNFLSETRTRKSELEIQD